MTFDHPGRECVECHRTSAQLHFDWDPRGPLCQDCWEKSAEQELAEMEAEAAWLEEQEAKKEREECR